MQLRPYDQDLLEVFMLCLSEMQSNSLCRLESFRVFRHLLHYPGNPIYMYLYGNDYLYEELFETLDKLLEETEKAEEEIKNEVLTNQIDIVKYERESFMMSICNLNSQHPEQNSSIEIITNKELLYVLTEADLIANRFEEEKLSVSIVSIAMIKIMPESVRKFFDTIGLEPELVIEDFATIESSDAEHTSNVQDSSSIGAGGNTTSTFKLPKEIASFVEVFNERINVEEPCKILGRDEEVKKLWNILSKSNKRNSILVGKPGVGKTAILEKMTYEIMTGKAPKEFENFVVLSLDVNSSIAGTMYRGQAEERFKYLIDYLKNQPKVILFIDEIHTIVGAGSTTDNDLSLGNALKPMLARGDIRVVGATTVNEYEKYFKVDSDNSKKVDGALTRRFEVVKVKEPKSNEVYPMIKNQIDYLSEYHGVKISKSMINFIILNASCFDNSTANPDRTLDLIDRSMVSAKLLGKKNVDKKCVLSNFDLNIKIYDKMDPFSKKATAYHEAGHFILTHFSKLKSNKTLAVSVMPARDYCGINVTEEDEIERYNIVPTREYYIDYIAMLLAGRVAEAMFTSQIASGADSDLNKASKIAYTCIMKYGLSSNFGNKVLVDDEKIFLQTEKAKQLLDEEVNKFLVDAEKRAKEVLNMHKDLLETLVDELLKKGILSEVELNKLLDKYQTFKTVN